MKKVLLGFQSTVDEDEVRGTEKTVADEPLFFYGESHRIMLRMMRWLTSHICFANMGQVSKSVGKNRENGYLF